MRKDSTRYSERVVYDAQDCSVRALAAAAGCGYKTASAIYSAAGRRMKAGTSIDISTAVHETWLGMKPVPLVAGMPLFQFVAMFKTGQFVVHKKGHAFAVINGVVHDWENTTRDSTLITRAWAVTSVTRDKLETAKQLFE